MQQEPAADTRALRHALEQVDELKRELTREKQRSTHLRLQLSKVTTRTNDAATSAQREPRPGC